MDGKDFFPDRNLGDAPLVVAHRGASAAAPENTIAAFELARTLGADGVELDVRRTAGETLAVSHDPHLSDGRALVGLSPSDLPEDVPDLTAALDACAGLQLVNVEIKNSPGEVDFDAAFAVADQVAAVLAARRAAERDRVVVSSFHRPTLDRMRELLPEVRTGWLVVGVGDDDGQAVMAEAARHGHGAVHPHHIAVTPRVVERAHHHGVALSTWTCDDPDRLRWLGGIGVDAVITNVPDVALAALGRRPPGP